MKRYYHRKLVRDKIPDVIKSTGDSYKARLLKASEFRKLLRRKLVEEARELVGASRDRLLNELADVLQVIRSIADFEKIPLKNIEAKRKRKEKEVGAFKRKIFLIWSSRPQGR